jgi:hypothetical protein
MGILFPAPALTEEQWLSGQPYEMLVNFAIRLNTRKFALARVTQFRRVWERLNEKERRAVESVERQAEDCDVSGGNPHHAVLSDAVTLLQFASKQGGIDSLFAVTVRDLHEIFGNPFRRITFSPDWHTDTAVSLARHMYALRDFSPMPILADALQDAGCDNEDILNHCRQPGEHVRGCWVVDLVLGKQ